MQNVHLVQLHYSRAGVDWAAGHCPVAFLTVTDMKNSEFNAKREYRYQLND